MMDDQNHTRKRPPRGRRRWQPLDIQTSSTPVFHSQDRSKQTPTALSATLAGKAPKGDASYENVAIPQTAELLRRMRKLILTEEILQKRGYVINQLSASDLEVKRKRQTCQRCGRRKYKEPHLEATVHTNQYARDTTRGPTPQCQAAPSTAGRTCLRIPAS